MKRRRRKKRQQQSLLSVIIIGIILIGLGGLFKGNGNSSPNSNSGTDQARSSQASSASSTGQTASTNKNTAQLAALNYQSGQSAIVQVNNGKSTLNPQSWDRPKIVYSQLDAENRSGQATAYLDSDTLVASSTRTEQRFEPTGWHNQPKYVDGRRVTPQNRGHLIAYSISGHLNAEGQYDANETQGSLDNPKNLFTQAAYANQTLQLSYEYQILDALKDGKKIIYQVTPIFSGSDLMAKGDQLQAVSTDGSLNFNVYIFNVQPGLVFDYATGTSQVDSRMTVPAPAGSSNNAQSSSTHKYDRKAEQLKRYYQKAFK
ncbi:DNA-entry nuclease [Lactobacillus selangorensis]|uniref:DNA-entry nuclease n=1 Tax=Lactobacillus selangorensis TaxID=81857 RepID=A0A0R2FXD5_9LACO|nr:DNA/RNA non-specific endonuclease [Lactobacillus selangorensis]KRN28936.1 DNA-entry nuclease [Lactobacillus selangorensis]KRN32654.1 DNA-entry nuclease [Lactobacillus selangorensis]